MLNTREIAEEYRLSHWAEVMRERSASGMSIRAYCKSIGLHENVYFYWQRKLRDATVLAAKQDGTGAEIKTDNEKSSSIPQGWAICETVKSDSSGQNTIRIEIGKSQVVAHIGTDEELLKKVCRMLMTLC